MAMIATQPRLSLLQPASVQAPSGTRIARTPRIFRNVRASAAQVAAPPKLQAVKPALLPGTPDSFPIPAEQLIELAKKVHATDTGVADDSVLAEDFRFEFPLVKLGKEQYLKAVRGFQLRTAIPDLNGNAYDWRVDSLEPQRVWFTVRTTGTHTGTLKFGRASYEATGRVIQGAPECCSYTFNEEGKVTSFTGGYVVDNRLGNTGGYGAAFGILTAIGVTIPKPNSLQYEFAVFVNNVLTSLDKVFKKE